MFTVWLRSVHKLGHVHKHLLVPFGDSVPSMSLDMPTDRSYTYFGHFCFLPSLTLLDSKQQIKSETHFPSVKEIALTAILHEKTSPLTRTQGFNLDPETNY